MKNFLKKLNQVYKNKYQFSKSSFKFLKQRNMYLKKIMSENKKIANINLKFRKMQKNTKFHTQQQIVDIYKNNNKRNLFLFFYKKFNYSLKLMKHYNQKTNSNEVNLLTYCLFGNILIKQKKFDDLQKLNTICKINDIILFKFDKKKHKDLIGIISDNIIFEKKMKTKYAKKFISYLS